MIQRCSCSSWKRVHGKRQPTGISMLLSFRQIPNAATDAAIVLRGKCRKPRVSGAMVLELLYMFMVAGAGYGEEPTLDIAA
ncbi:MAG: hypothetical protein RIR04_1669 [Pseudomonadota bacterium]|jgi:hypothetical protein